MDSHTIVFHLKIYKRRTGNNRPSNFNIKFYDVWILSMGVILIVLVLSVIFCYDQYVKYELGEDERLLVWQKEIDKQRELDYTLKQSILKTFETSSIIDIIETGCMYYYYFGGQDFEPRDMMRELQSRFEAGEVEDELKLKTLLVLKYE